MHTILDMEFPHEYFASSCNCHVILPHSSHHFSLHTISLYLSIPTTLSTFPSSIDVFVSFSTTRTEVREGNGSLALTLQSTRAASQPFTVHLNSRLLPPGANTATGEWVSALFAAEAEWKEVGLNDTDVLTCIHRWM